MCIRDRSNIAFVCHIAFVGQYLYGSPHSLYPVFGLVEHGRSVGPVSYTHLEKSKKGGIDLLQRISAKDLRDVRLEVLIDHMLSNVPVSYTHLDVYKRQRWYIAKPLPAC